MDNSRFLAELRRARGFSQTDLARAAGTALSTVTRLERLGLDASKPSTSLQLLAALERVLPLTDEELERFATQAGLGPSFIAGRAAAAAKSVADRAQPRVGEQTDAGMRRALSLRAFTAQLPADEARAYWYLADLLEHASPARVLALLEGAAKMADVTLEGAVPDDPPERVVRVVSPPIQRDGYVEQRIVEYGAAPERVPEQPRKAGPKPSGKRRSAQ